MSNHYVQQSTTVTAAQWLNDDASLHAIQLLLFPLSPYRAAHRWPEPSSTLGVSTTLTQGTLVWVEVGAWVVKTADGTVTIVSENEFAKQFRAVVAPATVRATSPAEHIGLTEIGEGLRDA